MGGESKLIRPDGAPLGAIQTSVGKVNHCGGCMHAHLLANERGELDMNVRTCTKMPPQITPIPQFARSLDGPRLIGFVEVTKYPPVAINMRACSFYEERTQEQRAIEDLDRAGAAAGSQAKN